MVQFAQRVKILTLNLDKKSYGGGNGISSIFANSLLEFIQVKWYCFLQKFRLLLFLLAVVLLRAILGYSWNVYEANRYIHLCFTPNEEEISCEGGVASHSFYNFFILFAFFNIASASFCGWGYLKYIQCYHRGNCLGNLENLSRGTTLLTEIRERKGK